MLRFRLLRSQLQLHDLQRLSLDNAPQFADLSGRTTAGIAWTARTTIGAAKLTAGAERSQSVPFLQIVHWVYPQIIHAEMFETAGIVIAAASTRALGAGGDIVLGVQAIATDSLRR